MDIEMDEYFKEFGVNHGNSLKRICHLTIFVVFRFAVAISWCGAVVSMAKLPAKSFVQGSLRTYNTSNYRKYLYNFVFLQWIQKNILNYRQNCTFLTQKT